MSFLFQYLLPTASRDNPNVAKMKRVAKLMLASDKPRLVKLIYEPLNHTLEFLGKGVVCHVRHFVFHCYVAWKKKIGQMRATLRNIEWNCLVTNEKQI